MWTWRLQRQGLAPGRERELKLVLVRTQQLAPEPGLAPGPEPVRALEQKSAQVRAQGALPAWRAAMQIVVLQKQRVARVQQEQHGKAQR